MNVLELARRADVTPSVVRFYARSGVLTPHPQPDGRFEYDESDAARLVLLVRLHRLGVRDPERLVDPQDGVAAELADGLRQLAERREAQARAEASGTALGVGALGTSTVPGRAVTGRVAHDARMSADVRRVLDAIMGGSPDGMLDDHAAAPNVHRGSWVYGSDGGFIGTVEAATPSLLRVHTRSQFSSIYYVPVDAILGQLGGGREVFLGHTLDTLPEAWLASPAVRAEEERERRHH